MCSSSFLAFILYFFILFIIGIFFHKKNATESDFIIGGRGLNYWVTALSAHASDMSSWLFMGFPMAVFLGGGSGGWIAIGLFTGMLLCWNFMAPAIRVETERFNSLTLSSYIECRSGDKTGLVRIVCAVMTLVFMLHYLAAGLTGMGFILESVFCIDYHIGITCAVIIIAIYTCYGGFITVAWTDLFQALFLLSVLILVPIIAFQHIEGWSAISTAASKKNIILSPLPNSALETLNIIFLITGWGLGYFGQPHIITKFMGIRDPNEMRKSQYVGMTWQFFALGSAFLCGLIGIAFHQQPLTNNELVFVEMVRQLFPELAAGIILCAILAATISTMDSQIIVCAGVLAEDFYGVFFKKKSQSQILGKSRLAVILTAFAAYLIAQDKSKTVMDAVSYSWVGLGCSFGPVLLSCLYYKPTNRSGILSGMLIGGGMAALVPSILPAQIPVTSIMLPAFSFSLATTIAVSKCTSR